MSADLLRRAAAKAREIAEAATPGPWGVGNETHIATEVEQTSIGSFRYGWMIAEVEDEDYRDYGGSGDPDEIPCGMARDDATHIALWHPAVAVAVADMLDQHAEEHGTTGRGGCGWVTCRTEAVARLLLGEDS